MKTSPIVLSLLLLTQTLFLMGAVVSGTGSGGGVTGWPTSSTTKEITWANSLANAVKIGDGSTPMCHYTDVSLGPVIRPCTDSNVETLIPSGFTWSLYDLTGGAAMLTVDPASVTKKNMYQFGANYRPTKSIWFDAGSLSTDGTQCAAPAEVTINSGLKTYSVICADNDSSTIYGKIRMPDNWDGGTVTFTQVYLQSAADTNALNGDIACQSRTAGEALNNTWGTEVAIDDAAVTGSNAVDMTTSAAAACSGTGVLGGDLLAFRYQLDATGTTTAVATLHTLGFWLNYSTTSLSN